MRPRLIRGSLQGGVMALLLLSPALAERDPWDWRTLELSAHSGVFMSGRVVLTIDEAAERRLLGTSTTARVFGALVARSRTQSIMDPATGMAHEYTSFSPKRGRHYIFNATGYTVKKLTPREGYDAPLAAWDVSSSEDFAYPEGAEGLLPVFDPYGLLLNLKRLELNRPGDEAVLFVATSRGPQRYTIRVGESRRQQRSYKHEPSGKNRTVDIEELLLLFEPDEQEADDRGLLGMRGSIEIWVEARSKTLIRVSGKVPDIPGLVVLKLSAMG